MLSEYLPVLLLAGLAFLFAALSLAASSFLRPHEPNPAKLAPYECGIEPERVPKGERFSVKFYVVEMGVFIALVFVAYVYIWQKGGLDWETTERRRFVEYGAALAEKEAATDEREALRAG